VVKEVGPPHDRSYVVRCSLKNPKNEVVVETVGEGRKKKEATQSACANVLSRLRGIENSPLFIASSLYKLQKRVLNPSREPKRKTIIKDMKMDPTYGHQINPVSRLIQVLQARCEDEPQFELISEQGQSRYKEFTLCETIASTWKEFGSKENRILNHQHSVFDPNDLITPPVQNATGCTSSAQPDQQDSRNSEEQSLQEGLLTSRTKPARAEPACPHRMMQTVEGSHNGSSPRRRVTFSNQVKACPPPAICYVTGRVKRIRRTKEAKRALSDDQKCEIREIARVSIQALQSPNMIPCAEGGPDSESCQLLSARRRLDSMSETFKFSVQYTNFPKVCHGRGSTMEAAAENAAFNAISNLCTYDQPVSPQEQQLGALSPCN
ncbi:hypothetical protein OSTOST_17536, partial [Ostertagia ostertagi]